MNASVVEEIELDLLLEAIYRCMGDDFRGFDRAVLMAKLSQFMKDHGIATVSALQNIILHDGGKRELLLRNLVLRPTALFDDPARLLSLREQVRPWLRSHALPRIWLAECACIEELYTLAILLEEEHLYDRTQIYVTVANDYLLQEIRSTGFAADKLAAYEKNYRDSGGQQSLGDYLTLQDGRFLLKERLQRNITWSQFSLVTDTSFNEFELIICCENLSDFGIGLRRRALRLFTDSLTSFGMLALVPVKGETSELETVPFSLTYKPLVAEHGIYRRNG